MKIKITNKSHPLFNREFYIVYKDGLDYKVKIGDELQTILYQDCEEIK